MSPNALAGLQSPSGGLSNPVNMQMMNAMAAMGGLSNMSAAQFLQMQQQILQNQQQIAAMAAGNYQQQASMRNNAVGSNRAPGSAFQGLTPNSSRTGGGPGSTVGQASGVAGGAGQQEEDVTDLKLLQDIPAWLRVLRLHKYTPNFEKMDWKDVVVMTDKDLEDKGVAALGARRKMLKTFESVREKHGIAHPPGSAIPEASSAAEAAAEEAVKSEEK
jgi:SAM domain (Sterile alpha motif)